MSAPNNIEKYLKIIIIESVILSMSILLSLFLFNCVLKLLCRNQEI